MTVKPTGIIPSTIIIGNKTANPTTIAKTAQIPAKIANTNLNGSKINLNTSLKGNSKISNIHITTKFFAFYILIRPNRIFVSKTLHLYCR